MNKILSNFLSNKNKKYIMYVDISGSIEINTYNYAFNTIKNKVGDNLLVGIFTHIAYQPHSVKGINNIKELMPDGCGGGTNFEEPFKFINNLYNSDELAGIIMLTDGYASWPKKEITFGVPTLWIIDNDDVIPPWGLYCKIELSLTSKISKFTQKIINKIYRKLMLLTR